MLEPVRRVVDSVREVDVRGVESGSGGAERDRYLGDGASEKR